MRKVLAVSLLLLLAQAAEVKLVDVMVAGETSVGCTEKPCKYAAFRIPGLIATGNGSLFAFGEGRKYSCGDFGRGKGDGQHDLVMRESADGGHTWKELRTLVDAISFWPNSTAHHAPEDGNAVWDPSPIWDEPTQTLFVFFNGPGREGCAETGLCQTWMLVSQDRGKTFASRNMTAHCQRNGTRPGYFAGNTPGGGHGLRTSTGRLILPMYAGTPGGASICYSDDHGETWRSNADGAALGGMAATEVEVAELSSTTTVTSSGRSSSSSSSSSASSTTSSMTSNTASATSLAAPMPVPVPVLYMTIRNDVRRAGEGARQYAISRDLGLTWGARLNVQVADPNCKGGVLGWTGAPVVSTAAAAAAGGGAAGGGAAAGGGGAAAERGGAGAGSGSRSGSGSRLVLSTAASCLGRFNQTIFVSTEDGAPGSWVYRQPVYPRTGYSTLQLVRTPAGRQAELTETGTGAGAGAGVSSSASSSSSSSSSAASSTAATAATAAAAAASSSAAAAAAATTTVVNLFEKDGCSFAAALVDPEAIIRDGPQGYMPCAAAHCPPLPAITPGETGKPATPATPPNPRLGFCEAPLAPTPPPTPPVPPTSRCLAELDAFCDSPTRNAHCVVATRAAYPDAQPFLALRDGGCTVEPKKPWPKGVPEGPCQAGGAGVAWRCYSHLSLVAAGGGGGGGGGAAGGNRSYTWSNAAVHPNAYCSEDEPTLTALLAKCMKSHDNSKPQA